MRESSYKIPGGKLVKVKLKIACGRIAEVQLLGDFFLHPEETLQVIEDSLVGSPPDKTAIEKLIDEIMLESDAILIGATAADIAKTILMAWKSE